MDDSGRDPWNPRRAATMRQASSTSGNSADISRKMLEVGRRTVKPKYLPGRGICPPAGPASDWGATRPDPPVTVALVLLAAAAIIILLSLWRRRSGKRPPARSQLLDAPAARVGRRRTARPPREALAGRADNPVRDALQEMLRQRLWLQQHGRDASLEQLLQVRDSIDAGRQRIDQQLLQIERARAPSLH